MDQTRGDCFVIFLQRNMYKREIKIDNIYGDSRLLFSPPYPSPTSYIETALERSKNDRTIRDGGSK